MSLLLEPGYRRLLAETHPELAIRDDRLEVPTFVAPLDVREPLLRGAVREVVTAFTEVTPGLVLPHALFLGTPFERYDQTHLLDEVHDPAALAAAALEAGRAEDAAVVVMTNVSPAHPRLHAWIEAGFVSLPSFPDTVVDLDVPDFEQHLLRLPQGDRSGMRRNIRRFERAGHTLVHLEDTAPRAAALFAAYRPFFERATVRWQPHSEAYFRRLSELGPRARITAAMTDDGDVAGFVVNFRDGHNFQAGRIGVSPRFDRKDAVYFRLLYHALEESFALSDTRRARLSLEPTGYRMKRHLGARSVPMVNLVMGVNATWRGLLGGFAGVGRRLLRHLEDRVALEQEY